LRSNRSSTAAFDAKWGNFTTTRGAARCRAGNSLISCQTATAGPDGGFIATDGQRNCFYLPDAGDFTLGVANVLLPPTGAVAPEVESLLTLLGSPELGRPDMPLSELVVPGVP
jgi:hypothetical protein